MTSSTCPAQPPQRPPSTEELALIHMDPRSRRLILGAMVYLFLGGLLGGIHPLLSPAWIPVFYLKVHVHLLTLGFFTMLIYGMTYHMLPRFCGTSLPAGGLTRSHEVMAHLGLWLQCGGWLGANPTLTSMGAGISLLAFLLFTIALWPMLRPPPPKSHHRLV